MRYIYIIQFINMSREPTIKPRSNMKPKLNEPVLVSCLPWLYSYAILPDYVPINLNLECPPPHPLPWHMQAIDYFPCPESKAFDVKGLPEDGGFEQLPVWGGEFEPDVLGIHVVTDP